MEAGCLGKASTNGGYAADVQLLIGQTRATVHLCDEIAGLSTCVVMVEPLDPVTIR